MEYTSNWQFKSIQSFQNKVLRNIVNARWYVRNANLSADLKILTVKEETKRCTGKYEARLHVHGNTEAAPTLEED